jgi:ferredoxin
MLVIKEDNLEKFLDKLREEFEFIDVRNDAPAAGLPFKKYFFPPVQEIFSTSGSPTSKKSKSDFILYGLDLPDLEALTQLDEIMEKPHEDYFYFQKRNQSIVIGLIRENVDIVPGGDIVLEYLSDNRYKVWQNTAKGKNLVKKNDNYFSTESGEADEKPPQIPKNESLGEWQKTMRSLLLDPELLSDAVEWSYGHEIWNKLGEQCLGCGICTYVCPLCYCFSIEDKVGLDDKCSRCRKWTACTLPEFARIAGGHSFRPTLKERYYNWFYHKFVRAYKEYGKSQCVGCGRCQAFCPAKIDIQEVLKTILEDYKKKNE